MERQTISKVRFVPMNRLILAVCLSLALGCSNDPGSMTKAEVEDKLKAALKLETVALSDVTADGYSGVGTSAGGAKWSISVVQDKQDKSLKYSAKSDKGDVLAGSFKRF
jgi:hypothetical protein